MPSHNEIEKQLRELALKCSTTHYLQMQSAFLITYPGNGAFRNHVAMGCGQSEEEAFTDYSTKLNIAITAMDLGKKKDLLARIKRTRAYEALEEPV